MLMAAYSVLLGFGLLASAPWWLFRMATTARYREGLGQRLGRVPAALRATVRGHRVIWVHAVSVGEVLAVTRLINELEAALKLQPIHSNHASPAVEAPWRVVISTTTRTGQALARERFGADRVFYLPLDLGWTVRAYLQALKPALLVLAESELWPRLLYACRQTGIPVAVVNARVSDRSFRRARRVRRLWTSVLRLVTRFLTQSDADTDRLRILGAEPHAVATVGNLKYDTKPPSPTALIKRIQALCAGRPLVVAGSTVEGEDELVLSAYFEVRQAIPEAMLILAPRHPERFKAVTALAEDFGALRASSLSYDSAPESKPEEIAPPRSEGNLQTPVGRAASPSDRLLPEYSVLVLDTIGDLASVYALADVVFIGGSLVPRGGHNPLEPARFGVPVLIGPSFGNFRDVVAAMQAANGILVVKDEEEFTAALIDLLTNSKRAHSLGERGQSVFDREGGATVRSIQTLMPLLITSDSVPQRESGAAAPREVSA